MKLFCKLGICISTLFLILLCAGCGKMEYSVKDFADVTVIGYTEHGTLSIKVSDVAVNKIYADGKKDKTAALRFADTFKFTYDGQDDEDSFFSNGDVVTINVAYDESLASSLGLTFVDSSFDFTVDGLQDKQELSPFDGLSVKFSGVAPYGTIQLDKANCIQYVIDNVTFTCDQYDLSNGDKVVVYAEFSEEQAERNGYVFTEDVKKYTVVGLPKYVKSLSGVTYDTTTAKMRKMVETYVSESEDGYKSFDWFFGEDDSEDSDDDNNDLDLSVANGLTFDSDIMGDDPLFNNGEPDDEMPSEESEESEEQTQEQTGETSSSSKKKKVSVVRKIKRDFGLCQFKAKFDYTPVACFYALNPVQLSDNQFYSVYKVKGTFLCEESGGTGFIKQGDTLVGELYVIARLTGGSVDIKNNLYYEDIVVRNYHSYSIHSVPQYSDVRDDIFGTSTYLIEELPYYEDASAYKAFVKKLESKSENKNKNAHISIQESSDSDKDDRKRDEDSETDTDTELEYSEDIDNNEELQNPDYGQDEAAQYEYSDGGYDDIYEEEAPSEYEDYGEDVYEE